MKNKDKTKGQLLNELTKLRQRKTELKSLEAKCNFMKKNCLLGRKKDNTFYTNEKVPRLPYKKRDFIEKHFQLLNTGGK